MRMKAIFDALNIIYDAKTTSAASSGSMSSRRLHNLRKAGPDWPLLSVVFPLAGCVRHHSADHPVIGYALAGDTVAVIARRALPLWTEPPACKVALDQRQHLRSAHLARGISAIFWYLGNFANYNATYRRWVLPSA